MTLSLVLLVSLLNLVSAQTPKELKEFSESKQWKKILYYENQKSLVIGDFYFLSTEGKFDPHSELNATIENLNKNVACAFPARTILINKKWPDLIPSKDCSLFEEFKKNLKGGKLYLVFASVYPNNPASMFGHTFLRMDRVESDKTEKSQNLLGYSFGFQAINPPNENAFLYTFKGIFGGYPALIQMKPYYMDIGIYNNGESRDLWEYEIPLSQEKKEFFIAHLWEVINTVGYNYYFFTENCSTFSLRLLEAIHPEIDFTTKNGLFVVPQETLKETVSKLN